MNAHNALGPWPLGAWHEEGAGFEGERRRHGASEWGAGISAITYSSRPESGVTGQDSGGRRAGGISARCPAGIRAGSAARRRGRSPHRLATQVGLHCGEPEAADASHRSTRDLLVRAGDSPPRGSRAAGRSAELSPLDDVTLARLTWLWLAYSIFALAAGGRRLPTVCPYRLITGHRCPLCGLTRSTHFLMRGQITTSFEQHRVGPLLYGGSALLLAWSWCSRSRNRCSFGDL